MSSKYLFWIIPCLAVAMLITSVLTALWINPRKFHFSRINVFVTILAGYAIFIISLNTFLTSYGLEQQSAINTSSITKQAINKLWLYPNEVITHSKNARPEFIGSLYYNNETLFQLTKDLHTEITYQSTLEEQSISIILIQCWEDYLTFRLLDKTGDQVWLNNFLQWAQSPCLKSNFDHLKNNFAPLTIKFAEFMFEHASKLPVPTTSPELYEKIVKEMLQNPQLLQIYKDRENL